MSNKLVWKLHGSKNISVFQYMYFKKNSSVLLALPAIWMLIFGFETFRSLEVLQQKGKRHSDILKDQQSSDGGSSTGGGLRYPNALILWLQCNQVNCQIC